MAVSTKIREELSEKFGDQVASDDKLISECITLCQIYNLSAEDLFYKWEAMNFLNRNVQTYFTMDSAHALKAQIHRDLAAESARRQQAKSNMLAGMNKGRPGGMARFDMRMDVNAMPAMPIKSIPRSDKLDGLTRDNAGRTAGLTKVSFKGPKGDEESRRKRAYRYMYEKVSERSEVLDDRIDELAEIIREYYNISDMGDPGSSTEDQITVVGRITLDAESSSSGSVKLNEASLALESSRMMGSGARVPLRFDPQVTIRGGVRGAGGIGLFPGAIVALRGRNGGGGWFLVTEILAIPPLKTSVANSIKFEDSPFSMYIASGPYTPDTDLKYKPWHNFLENMKSTTPKVVLLVGPFIDSSHTKVKNGAVDRSPSQLFHEQFTDNLRDFFDVSPDSLVLIVPSVRDLVSDHAVFPQCELSGEFASDPRVRLLPNPSRFSLNGVSFAVSSVDVLFHLRKEEFFKRAEEIDSISLSDVNPGNDSMSNICRHLLQQRSYYPIFPVPLDLSHEINLDITHAEGLKLGEEGEEESAPDVLVVPSRLKHFSKWVDNTVAINPSSLTKGMYSTLMFAGQGVEDLKDRLKVNLNVVKLDEAAASDKRSSSKHKRSHERDHSHKHKKNHTHDEDVGRKPKRKRKDGLQAVNNEQNDDIWVEKNIDMDNERLLATNIPTSESLALTSSASHTGPLLKESLKRDEWMLMPTATSSAPTSISQLPTGDEFLTNDYGEPSQDARTLGGGVDFFATLGTERQKQPPVKRHVGYKELNPILNEGKDVDPDARPPSPKPITPGGPGSQWRMMRLRRVFETAEEEGQPLEQIALERFGSLRAFEEAKEERRVLDERENKRADRGRVVDRMGKGRVFESEKRFMFTDIAGSGASSRSSSFRRPGGIGGSAPSTPSPTAGFPQSDNKRLDSLRLPSQSGSPLAQSHTPIPSIMTPPTGCPSKRQGLSSSSLNKLQAKVLRAKLMGAPDANALEREYEEESRRVHSEGGEETVRTRVEVLPTLDGQGRLYDVGHGKEDDNILPGNRKKKEKVETRDRKTGDIVRYNADDDSTTLGDMLRHEKFGAGIADQKNLDAQFARAIIGDGKFQNDLDYIDDNAEKLGRQKMRSDAMKRQFAIHDYKRTQKVMASCQFCFGEDDTPPRAPIVAMGTRVYLSCTMNEELVEGHCLIVPIQHHLNMLEGDDDVWDEVRNFMKCLMRMFAEEDKGVIFYETVIDLKWQKHTYIECVPLPWAQYEYMPGYFKESILQSEAEWSQHKKLIDFAARPGGFRRAMVPNLPYFMVQFDHKGEKGYGHIIEGMPDSAAANEEDGGMGEGEQGGGMFPAYFASEIIGNVLEVQPRRWRRPRRIDFRDTKDRVSQFRTKYDGFDWTGMIGR